MDKITLEEIVAQQPFHDYATWWGMGREFLTFMSEAIVSQWSALPAGGDDLASVKEYGSAYIDLVYNREARDGLVDDFESQDFSLPFRSGEFDALSYAFFRSAFERIAAHPETFQHPVERERRQFTQRVGKVFFQRVQSYLGLDLPGGLESQADYARLQTAVQQVGDFLIRQGYLRDHFAFLFDVQVAYRGKRIDQDAAGFLTQLQNGLAYALYEMGYPVILPSAVYLFHTIGEAQHHSSRTIEELFALCGYEARETDDFDPTEHPSDHVVELWEIRRRSGQ